MDQKRAAVFLDRDGTLIKDRHYLSDPSQVELTDGCIAGLLQLSSNEFVLVMITNQSGIARGLVTREQMEAVNNEIIRTLARHDLRLDGIYYCPHHPDDQCKCRTPRAGMIEQATRQLSIEVAHSWVIGDKCSDVLLGQKIGARTILVGSAPDGPDANRDICGATAFTDNLSTAAAYVISHAIRESHDH